MAKRPLRDADGQLTLFDRSIDRVPGPRRPQERAYQFYDRVAGARWDEHREFVDRCFRHLPRTELAQVAGQWRGGQDDQLAASWWEMLLHETLLTLGLSVRAHADSESGTRADFHVMVEDGGAFYLEAHRLGPSSEERAWKDREDSIYAALEKVEAPEWRLHARQLHVGGEPRDFDSWTRDINLWLAKLPREEGHLLELRADDWHLVVEAIPWEVQGHPYPRPVLIYPVTSGVKDIGGEVRKPLLHKVDRYPGLSPLVVAVCTGVWDMGEDDVLAALCGGPVLHLDEDLNPAGASRSDDGLWVGPDGPRNQHLAAVVIGREISPGNLDGMVVEFWTNPWADQPVVNPCPIWETVTIQLPEGTVGRVAPPLAPRTFFGLADDWGTADPYPEVAAWRRSRVADLDTSSEL